MVPHHISRAEEETVDSLHQQRTIYLLKRVELAVRARLDRTTRDYGLTTPQYTALSVLRLHPGLSAAQLARRAFVSAQAMTEMVAALEAKNVIQRRPDETNRRILRAYLTAEGRRILTDCDAAVDELETRMLGNLDEQAVATLRHALLACADGLSPMPE